MNSEFLRLVSPLKYESFHVIFLTVKISGVERNLCHSCHHGQMTGTEKLT